MRGKIEKISPQIQVLMLTTYDEGDMIFDSLRAGANGYLLENMPQAEMVQAVQQVHAQRRAHVIADRPQGDRSFS